MKTYIITYKTKFGTKFNDKIEATDKYDAIQVAKAKANLYDLILISIAENQPAQFNMILL